MMPRLLRGRHRSMSCISTWAWRIHNFPLSIKLTCRIWRCAHLLFQTESKCKSKAAIHLLLWRVRIVRFSCLVTLFWLQLEKWQEARYGSYMANKLFGSLPGRCGCDNIVFLAGGQCSYSWFRFWCGRSLLQVAPKTICFHHNLHTEILRVQKTEQPLHHTIPCKPKLNE